MKKKILLVALLFMTLIVTGCDTKEETKVLTCSRSATVTEGVRMELLYKATYTGDYVDLVETEEKIISNNTSVLEAYKTSIESIYSPYKDVEHYNYSVEISGDTLISTTKIDYSKIDIDKLLEIDSANSEIITNGKVKLDAVKSMYELVGATCE